MARRFLFFHYFIMSARARHKKQVAATAEDRLEQERKARTKARNTAEKQRLFTRYIAARAIPKGIVELQELVHSDGSPRDGVDAAAVNRVRRALREGRV